VADIVLDKVSKQFPGGTMAVREVDLRIADGEFVILVGPSGCGKSTLLNMIAGLEDISSGELRIGGERVNDRQPRERDIAMVFQSYALYPNMSVRENIAFPLRLAKVDKSTLERRVRDTARLLELTELLDRRPVNLSGGQRQRVAMGRAIVRSPKAFLMDEPLSNLDAKLRVQMRTVVARLQKKLGTTMVYVTHDQTEAMTLGDRVVVLRGGVVQQVGQPQDLYDNPVNIFVAGFIGSPAMNFVRATVVDGALRTVFGDLPVGQRLRRLLDAPDVPRELVMGVRPEHFLDAERTEEQTRGPGVRFAETVDLVESLGSDKYVYFTVEGATASVTELEELAADTGSTALLGSGSNLVTRFPAESTATEGRVHQVWLPLNRIHLFNPSTGRNLTLHEGVAHGVVAG
jgi:multiple sugar transport system ATP-binding protein